MKPKVGKRIIFIEKDLSGREYRQKGIIDYIPEPPNTSMLIKLPDGKKRIIFPEQIREL